MPRFVNPPRIAAPASNYSHGVVHGARARRLIISGQVGMRLDGSVPEGLREQIELAFDNLLAVITEAGMVRTDIVKISAFCTVAGGVAPFRRVRDRKLDRHAPASTYLQVAGLAAPALLFELEGEAVSEEPDMLFEELASGETVAQWGKK